MKLSFDWLSQFVDLSGLSAHEVAEKLTMGAFEVEEVSVFGSDLEGPIVVGEILEIHPHPNADKIRLTKTRIAEGEEPLEIVCGAGNIEVGQRIPVALAGAKVLNRHDGTALFIKTSAIRGVKSNGMLCSAAELGVDSDGDGILILNQDGKNPALGEDVKALLAISPDYVLHVEPRSNRGDALSVAGLAREVAALFNRPLKEQPCDLAQYKSGDNHFATKAAVVENESDCPYLSLIAIEGIKVGPSNGEIVKKLEAIGLRPVNNVVDITNYVMHELGQPLHAYDADKLKSESISARRAKADETITTLDDKERKLNEEVLIIADGDVPVGIAGIMGGKDSEINEASTGIILEAACFTPAVVRRGSRLLGHSTDASLRFERGVDAASVLKASERAAYLICKYCSPADKPAKITAVMTAGSDKVAPSEVKLRLSAIKRILAIDFDKKKVETLLTPLGFSVKGEDTGNELTVSVPSFRQNDVKREIDLIEEVCRLNGYDAIESTMPASTACGETVDDTLSRVRNTLIGQGLSEAWLSSLVPSNQEAVKAEYCVRVLNPLSKDHELLRQSLVPGLVSALAYNQDRGRKDVWLFETGRTYLKRLAPENGQKKANTAVLEREETGVEESLRAAGIICGSPLKIVQVSGNEDRLNSGFYQAKGLLENILSALGLQVQKLVWSKPSAAYAWLHPHRTAVLALNRPPRKGSDMTGAVGIFGNPMVLGYVGQIHPKYADERGLKDAFVFEVDVDRLRNERKLARFSEIALTPLTVRDMTLDLAQDSNVYHQDVQRIIADKGGSNLKSIELVSIYQPDSGKSLTYRLTFQNPTETLTNEEIDKVLTLVRETLTKELNASFRL